MVSQVVPVQEPVGLMGKTEFIGRSAYRREGAGHCVYLDAAATA